MWLRRQFCASGIKLLFSRYDWGDARRDYDWVVALVRRILADGTPEAVRHTLAEVSMGNHQWD